MKARMAMAATVLVLWASASVPAGIPLPDAVLHGSIGIEGGADITSTSDVTVIARVGGVPVGVYRMGDNPTAGDSYVLRIRVEHGTQLNPVSGNAVGVGQLALISIRVGNNAEVPMGAFRVPGFGVLEQRNLCRTDSVVDLADVAELAKCDSTLPTAHCPCADLDGDNRSDLRDWAKLQNEFSGI